MRNKKLIKSFKSLKSKKVSYFSNGEKQTLNIIEGEMPMLNDEMKNNVKGLKKSDTRANENETIFANNNPTIPPGLSMCYPLFEGELLPQTLVNRNHFETSLSWRVFWLSNSFNADAFIGTSQMKINHVLI